MLKILAKFFGNKSAKEVKKLLPLVAQIHARCETLRDLSDDELRKESQQLRSTIAESIQPLKEEIKKLRERAASSESSLEERETIFSKAEELKKDQNHALTKSLDELLVPAFALMKETARRFTSGKALSVTATDMDRVLAAKSNYVKVEKNTAYWTNEWTAAGNAVQWRMVHYDVQLIGGIILHQGSIAEMATGEGKTLVATLPAFLNGLSGLGVHIVTVNDYLARRDAAWNGPLFEFHGLRVDCIDAHEAHSPARATCYQADIIYGTNNEFGFDYLRDNMARRPEELVQRGHYFAMVDEVDSVLIDEARTPLIISGPVDRSNEQQFYTLKPRVQRLIEAQRALCTQYLNDAKKERAAGHTKEGGLSLFRTHRGLPKYKPLIRYLSEEGSRQLMLRTESLYLQENQRLMPEADAPLYFTIDEKNHSIDLTEKGLDLIASTSEEQDLFIIPDIGSLSAQIENDTSLSKQERAKKKEALMQAYAEKSERIHTLNQLLRAYTLYERDTDYVVMDGSVKIVDEQTGRILDGRRYSDGLHQALEAKEHVKVEESTQTYATITLQNYFRMYNKLAGMTGTAETEAGELWNIYKLDVTVVPTHEKAIREDKNDRVYKTMREKFQAIIDEVSALREAKRPVLVGTTSVETSELLSRLLQLRRIPHQVLNAKQHQHEAEVVAEAGKPSTVTIATNMAGRGTDIKLDPASREADGLAIVGSERHEARRVDRQLRGRSGRQGDPGSSQFFVSLEDNLMRLFGSDRIARWMDRLGLKEGEVIEHSMITSSIERAQKKVEENNFGIRKRLLEYDNVMNAQREVIYTRRRHALFGERLQLDLDYMCTDIAEELATDAVAVGTYAHLQLSLLEIFGSDLGLQESDCNLKEVDALSEQIRKSLRSHYEKRKEHIRTSTLPVLRHTYEQQGAQVEQVVVPLSVGSKQIDLFVPLKRCVESEGEWLVQEMEKTVCLRTIDTAWKEHLREMDDLKQSVQNVVYEQKDPLLVYKFEAFGLFKKLLSLLNRETLGFLLRAEVPRPDASDLRPTSRMSSSQQTKLQESKEEAVSTTGRPTSSAAEEVTSNTTQPIRSEKIAGRNDKVTVQYSNGRVEKEIKYKKVAEDVKQNRCVVLEVHS